MPNNVALTTIYYDPEGRLLNPVRQALPVLQSLFDQITVLASQHAHPETVALLRAAGCHVVIREEATGYDVPPVGLYRRTAVSHALQHNPNHIIYCDFDRAAHWANFYPDELKQAIARLPEHDFWVYGRTQRAFDSHPPSMTRTESMINDLFAQASGLAWDVLAATRGMSAAVARFIVANSTEDSFGNDPAWPLLVRENGRFSLGYLETEGMEFETADAFPQEIAAAGSVEAWLAQQEQDPTTWLYRLKAAVVEVEAIRPFYPK
jgi:hypothetical protein